MKGVWWLVRQCQLAYLLRVWWPVTGWLHGSWWAPYVPFVLGAGVVVWVLR